MLTKSDIDNYGSDLAGFSMRAAAHALTPYLQNLEQQNAQLAQRLAQEQRHRLDQAVEQAIPNYREVDRDPGWHQFLRTVDPFSGRVRQVLLNDAIQQADAPRIISFFRSYLREAGGQAVTGAGTHTERPGGSLQRSRMSAM